jgi:leucyl aminopeptidase
MELRLRVLIPAVENAVAGNAFRPGDILTARNGLTIEINNTDAEGRLVLADALALASRGRSRSADLHGHPDRRGAGRRRAGYRALLHR